MPAFVFATREMNAAALPLLDELREPITVLRNPIPGDSRSVHVVTDDQFARLRPRFAAEGIQIEMLDQILGRAASKSTTAAAVASPASDG